MQQEDSVNQTSQTIPSFCSGSLSTGTQECNIITSTEGIESKMAVSFQPCVQLISIATKYGMTSLQRLQGII